MDDVTKTTLGLDGSLLKTDQLSSLVLEDEDEDKEQDHFEQSMAKSTSGAETVQQSQAPAALNVEEDNTPPPIAAAIFIGNQNGFIVRKATAPNETINGDGNKDRIILWDDSNTSYGYGKDDEMFGRGGIDELYGDDGNDKLYGEGGDDVLHGGDGADKLYGDQNDVTGNELSGAPDDLSDLDDVGDDTLNGGAGDDHLYGDGGNDTLNGGDDDDHLYGGDGADKLCGDGGNDVLKGGSNATPPSNAIHSYDYLNGGEGINHLYGGTGSNLIEAGAGVDTAYFSGALNTYNISFNQVLGTDVVVVEKSGESHNLKYDGNTAIDQFNFGGTSNAHNDGTGITLSLGQVIATDHGLLKGDFDHNGIVDGADRALWESEFGSTGFGLAADQDHDGDVDGFGFLGWQRTFGSTADSLNVNLQTNSGSALSGGAGIDVLLGHSGDETLNGGDGDDILFGGYGVDTINGGDDNDHLYGQDGNDILNGGNGNDVLDGGNGNDIMNGGSGHNEYSGGDGNDTVIFNGNILDYVYTMENGHVVLTHKDNSTEAHLIKDDIETLQFANTSQDYANVVDAVLGVGALASWESEFGSTDTDLEGDLDRDGDVDGSDFLSWQRNFTPAPAPPPEPNSLAALESNFGMTGENLAGDNDQDGDVDGSDFLSWQRNFTPAPAAAMAVIDEGSTLQSAIDDFIVDTQDASTEMVATDNTEQHTEMASVDTSNHDLSNQTTSDFVL